MAKPKAVEAEDKDLPLRDDIGLLGRILGDTCASRAARLSLTASSIFAKTRSAFAATRMLRRGVISKRH